jgi:hypothetical protein
MKVLEGRVSVHDRFPLVAPLHSFRSSSRTLQSSQLYLKSCCQKQAAPDGHRQPSASSISTPQHPAEILFACTSEPLVSFCPGHVTQSTFKQSTAASCLACRASISLQDRVEPRVPPAVVDRHGARKDDAKTRMPLVRFQPSEYRFIYQVCLIC